MSTKLIDRKPRPGGRTAAVTRRIHEAVLDLLVERGIDQCTFPAVAERAGVERSTLYRRFPDRWAMILDAIADRAQRDVTASTSGRFADDLRQVLTSLAAILATPLGAAVMMVAAAMRGGSAPAHRERFWTDRLRQLEPMFDAALARGELAPDTDCEDLFAAAAGPVFFRTFVMQRPVEAATIEAIVEDIVERYG